MIKDKRKIKYLVEGVQTSDGAGVNLTRIIGSAEFNMLDPFLLLDEFGSDNPDDYIAGFPPHPHRGFETVTYMINGKFHNQDSTGHERYIQYGSVPWMTAGEPLNEPTARGGTFVLNIWEEILQAFSDDQKEHFK